MCEIIEIFQSSCISAPNEPLVEDPLGPGDEEIGLDHSLLPADPSVEASLVPYSFD